MHSASHSIWSRKMKLKVSGETEAIHIALMKSFKQGSPSVSALFGSTSKICSIRSDEDIAPAAEL